MDLFIDTKIEFLKGVGPVRAALLQKELAIFTYRDLLLHFPFRYVDKSNYTKIATIHSEDVYVLLKGRITRMETVGQAQSSRLVATLQDESGNIDLVWFQGAKWIKEQIKPNVEYVVFGKPSLFNKRFNIPHPELEVFNENTLEQQEKYTPIYSLTEKLKSQGLGTRAFAKLTKALVSSVRDKIPESLPHYIINHLRLISKENAILNIHYPESLPMLENAKLRLKFEELFFLQLEYIKTQTHRKKNERGFVFPKVGDCFNKFFHNYLPFSLTGAQQRVIKEIRNDMKTGFQMNRLLQGDVGSGKTLVALFCMLIALDNRFQACLMVPTEILATQHFNSISNYLKEMNIVVELLTGSIKLSDKRKIKQRLKENEIHLLIGTHALLEEDVQFANLGLVVIDEQHRFGVEQRARMWTKNHIPPHILVMTATPIPRTLAMTIYGDLDYSIIDELPLGRKPIKTAHFYDSGRLKVFSFMKEQIKLGRQVYVVYPLINESETLDLKDLMDGYESISRDFPIPDYQISIVHGQMKAADKEYEMQRFKRGETHIMIATTVIEVGVDVPNATVMVIENAERFGLSQLHQLRGRVGRGAEQSYCILMSDYKLSSDGRKRLETMVRTTDGFEIAEADLKLRGPGEIQGTQQSGIVNLKIADLVKDEKIIKVARDLAIQVFDEDPQLVLEKNASLRLYFVEKKHRNDFSRIS